MINALFSSGAGRRNGASLDGGYRPGRRLGVRRQGLAHPVDVRDAPSQAEPPDKSGRLLRTAEHDGVPDTVRIFPDDAVLPLDARDPFGLQVKHVGVVPDPGGGNPQAPAYQARRDDPADRMPGPQRLGAGGGSGPDAGLTAKTGRESAHSGPSACGQRRTFK